MVLSRLSSAVATQLASTVGCLQDSYVGTLQRCLESLEKHCMDTEEGSIRATDALRQVWAQVKKTKDLFLIVIFKLESQCCLFGGNICLPKHPF